jgi:hypothetical protein
MRDTKIYPFIIPAGGVLPLPVSGDMFRIMASTGPLSVIGSKFGSLGPINAGQGLKNREFDRLILKDESGATNVGTILIGETDFIDYRISGEVSVISGERARVIAGTSFYALPYAPANPGFYSHAQLANPAASTKTLMIEQITVEAPGTVATYNFTLRQHGLLLAQTPTVPTPINKRSGGGASAAVVRYDNTSASLLGQVLAQFPASQAVPFVHTPKGGPICLPPGYTLVVAPGAVNVECFPFFEFYEEPA